MKTFVILACLALASVAPLSAQAPAPQDSVPPRSADTLATASLKPVRLSARRYRSGAYAVPLNASALRTPTRILDLPQAISIVTSELIRDRSIQSVAEAVRFMPGVMAGQGEGNRDHVVIRGNGSTADFYVDGVRDDVQFFRDTYNVDRIEALKGPNAMAFGRGGGGGLLNRVMKEPDWSPARRMSLERGTFGHTRATADMGVAPTAALAARVNGLYEASDSFRDGVSRMRYGVNPALKLVTGRTSSLRLDVEHFRDDRTADRGIPSFQGRPFRTDRSTFFGDPAGSKSDARINAANATFAHGEGGPVVIRNHTRLADYDKFYQNVFPGAITADGSTVSISAYNNRTQRSNIFNQTDAILTFRSPGVRHTLLAGAEIGRQVTDNFRNTGYFNNTATSLSVPASSPTVSAPVTYRQSASDADNHVTARTVSTYVQDQLTIGSRWIAVAGVRYESFDLSYRNNRNDARLERTDVMVSPRVGITHKAGERLSLYAMYGVSHLPSSGDQFASLTDVTKGLEPERFQNREIGAKWKILQSLEMSAAWYVLDRSNTRANDPTDPGRTVQTGSQRSSGYEMDFRGAVTPAWDLAGGISRQNARIRSATTAAPAGSVVPLAPRTTAALWSRHQLTSRLGLAGGYTYQAKSFAAIDNAVTLPAFSQVDGAVYYQLAGHLHAQLNVMNLLDEKHHPTANNNNNISPGEPRSFRLSISTDF